MEKFLHHHPLAGLMPPQIHCNAIIRRSAVSLCVCGDALCMMSVCKLCLLQFACYDFHFRLQIAIVCGKFQRFIIANRVGCASICIYSKNINMNIKRICIFNDH